MTYEVILITLVVSFFGGCINGLHTVEKKEKEEKLKEIRLEQSMF